MITTSAAAFVLEDGSEQKFDGSSIITEPTYFTRAAVYSIKLRVVNSGSIDIEMRDFYMQLTKATVDTFTGTGTGDTAKMLNAVEQAVVDALESIPDNSGVTFTIV